MVIRKLIYSLLFFGVNLSFASDNNKLADIKGRYTENKLTDISMRYTEPSSVLRPRDFRELGRVLAGFTVGACCLEHRTTSIFGTALWGCGLYFANQCNKKNSVSTNKKSYVKKFLLGSLDGGIMACLPKNAFTIGVKDGNKILGCNVNSGVEAAARSAAVCIGGYAVCKIGLSTLDALINFKNRKMPIDQKSFEDRSDV